LNILAKGNGSRVKFLTSILPKTLLDLEVSNLAP